MRGASPHFSTCCACTVIKESVREKYQEALTEKLNNIENDSEVTAGNCGL